MSDTGPIQSRANKRFRIHRKGDRSMSIFAMGPIDYSHERFERTKPRMSKRNMQSELPARARSHGFAKWTWHGPKKSIQYVTIEMARQMS